MRLHRLGIGTCAAFFFLTPVVAGAQTATPAWSSGFESGFPGEFLDYANGWSSSGADLSGRTSSWTIVDRASGEPVFEGEHAYRGRIVAPNSDVNRAYPALHTDIPSPYVNSWMVYVDVDYDQLGAYDWISLGTWSNDPDWVTLATLSLRDRRIEMAHVDWEYVGPQPQPELPLRRWIRFTTYIDHTSGGELAIWQDGVLVIRGTFASDPGDHLLRAHWGLYAEGTVPEATMYNDAMQIWTLSAPLGDFTQEPESPFGPYVDGGTGGDGGGGGGGVDAGAGGMDAGAGGMDDDAGGADAGGGGTDDGGGNVSDPVAVGCAVTGGAVPSSPADALAALGMLLLVTVAFGGRAHRSRPPRRA